MAYEKQRRYVSRHRKGVNKIHRDWVDKNRERVNAYQREWRKNNADKVKEYETRRRTKEGQLNDANTKEMRCT